MLEKGDKIALSVIGILTIILFVFWTDIRRIAKKDNKDQVANNSVADNQARNGNGSSGANVQIVESWTMPSELLEISGIAWIDDSRFACVQDEEGKIFIYNITNKNIEKTISFAAPGDYEGIAITEKAAWVLRADGTLFELADYTSAKPTAVQHKTTLTEKHDVEGLNYDFKNNRLLLAIKGKEPSTDEYKGIYEFDLETKKFNSTPVYKLQLADPILKDVKKKQKYEPSDLAIHPLTNDVYILEGAEPKLLVLSPDGKMKKLVWLKNKEFIQPEGIDFNSQGELFISNEGQKKQGNILKVNIPS